MRPRSERERLLLLELLDASAACFNEVTYARRQTFFEARREPTADSTSTIRAVDLPISLRDQSTQRS